MPNPDVADFSVDLFVCSIGGVIVTGFAPGADAFKVEFGGDRYKSKHGSHGTMSVSKLPPEEDALTITLLHGSPSHKTLRAAEDLAYNSSAPRMALVAQDVLGRTSWTGEVWPKKRSPVSLGDEGGDHVHTFGGRIVETST